MMRHLVRMVFNTISTYFISSINEQSDVNCVHDEFMEKSLLILGVS